MTIGRNTNYDEKRRPGKYQFLVLLPFAFCYAFFIVLGDWQKSAPYSNAQNMARLAHWMAVSYGVLLLLGFFSENGGALLAAWLPAGMRRALSGFASLKCLFRGRKREGRLWVWLLFSLLCLLCYLPYYLIYYPTWFNNDAVWQMEQALGLAARSNHHPYFHTLIIKVFLTAGYGIFGSYTAAVALYTFFQMALTAAVFGFFLYLLYCRGTGILWLVLAAFFYAVLPVNGMFSICMGKDAWFTAAFLLFMWSVWVCAREGEKRRQWAAFLATGLLVCLLRSNGIFIFLGTTLVLILSQIFADVRTGLAEGGCGRDKGRARKRQKSGSRKRQYMYLSAASAILCYLLWQGPILKALQVEPPDTIESLTMPTQHLLCAYVRGGELTPEEVEMLEAVAPLAQIDDYYNPYLFDVTKNYIREHGNQQVIADYRGEYAKLWLKVGFRNPMLYLEAQIRQTAGYYALHIPHDQILYSEYFMVDNPFGIENERKVFSYDAGLAMGDFLQGFQAFYNRVWSLGMNTWLLLAAFACALYRRRDGIAFVPCVMLLGSLFLAAPVYNEFRYAYGVFVALPFLFAVGFGKEAEADEQAGAAGRDRG